MIYRKAFRDRQTSNFFFGFTKNVHDPRDAFIADAIVSLPVVMSLRLAQQGVYGIGRNIVDLALALKVSIVPGIPVDKTKDHFAMRKMHNAGDQFKQRRFAASIWPCYHPMLAIVDRPVEIVKKFLAALNDNRVSYFNHFESKYINFKMTCIAH